MAAGGNIKYAEDQFQPIQQSEQQIDFWLRSQSKADVDATIDRYKNNDIPLDNIFKAYIAPLLLDDI